MTTLISIVIITYNRERYLRAAIESVLSQTYPAFELLVWDDGSEDSSVAIAREYAERDQRVRVIAAQHQGTAAACKAAMSETIGTYIGWLDDDDRLAPTALAETAAVLDRQPDVGLVYTDYLVMDADSHVKGYGKRCQIPYSRDGLLVNFMTFHFRLFRRTVFKQIDGIDTSLRYAMDYDLCLQLSEVTEVRHLNKPLYYYRNHAGSLSHQHHLEQICDSHRAITAALKRRGLADRLQLIVQMSPTSRTAWFELRPKQRFKTKPPVFLPQRALFGRSLQIASLVVALLPLGSLFGLQAAQAQSIISAPDGTGTIVAPNGNQIDISGGQLSADQQNLFHSFTRFGLTSGQIANFLANPALKNILGRVVGGEPSMINGLIQISGGNSNLFLLNPAGIVFGANARLHVPAAFTATTANAVGFGNQWFSAIGSNNYAALIGNPTSLAFTTPQPGTIVNAGNLAVGLGQSLTLLGGTVFSPGTLSAPDGQLLVASVPGQNLVRLTQPGSLLSFEIQPIGHNSLPLPPPNLQPPSLAQLLTGGNLNNATGVTINPDGSVQLTGSPQTLTSGDVAVRQATAQTVTLSAQRHLTLVESQLQATGNLDLLAGNTVFVRDSVAHPFTAQAGGNLYIRGNQGIDILALKHLQTAPFQSGGDLSLVSDGLISGDSHFSSGGNFAVRNLSGGPGVFVSFYDPIITVAGDFNFGPYTGVALKVQAGGNITFTGDITITGPDETATGDPDSPLLTSSRALILNTTSGNISVGNINTNVVSPENGGPVILNAAGSITTGVINSSVTGTSFTIARGGAVTLTAGSDLTTGDINSSYAGGTGYGAEGGPVTLQAGGRILTGAINTSAITNSTFAITGSTYRGGAVTLTSGTVPGSNITFSNIDTRGIENLPNADGGGGNVAVLATGLVEGTSSGNTIITQGSSTSGTITIQHDGGPNNLPFVVGSGSPNGTAGAIVRSPALQITNGSFPVQPPGGSVTPVTGIQITSVNTPPSLTATSPLSGATQNTTFSIPYTNLAPQVTEPNSDVSTIRIVAIAPGATLTLNGNPVVPGTTLSPGETLEYTPPANATGLLNAFSLQADDGVSNSNPVPIAINVSPPIVPPDPPDPPNPPDPPDPPDPPELPETPPCILTNCTTSTVSPLPGVIPRISFDTRLTPEATFTRQFEAYLGLQPTPLRSIDEEREIVRQIERATGAKPAFIYVGFVPVEIQSASIANQTSSAWQPDASAEQLELVVVTAEGNPIRKRIAGVTKEQVLAVAQQFQREVSDPRKVRSTSYLPSAQQLYQWLIAPLQADLQARTVNNLVFILDAGLRSLPIAALHDGNQFLIEQYSVGLMPSLSLTDTRYQDIRDFKVLGLGISESTQGQPPLPAVVIEINNVVNQLWSGQTALNEQVTLETLKSLRKEQPFGIIHLATHANFRPGTIENSYIQLWNSKLRLNQIRQLGLNQPQVELLVLSACATALGDREAELGFAGLAVQTGVKTVIASLWYVDDVATTSLMSGFYQNLRTANIKAEALRQAQLKMARGELRIENGQLQGSGLPETIALASQVVRDRAFQHPYYWAAFTTIGNPW